MLQPISDKPAEITDTVNSVKYVADFKNITEKVDKLQKVMKVGLMDGDLIKYLLSMTELAYQGLL